MNGLRGDRQGAIPWPLKLVGLILAATIVAALYSHFLVARSGDTLPVIESADTGDAVEIDYIGSFDDERVFDTSLYSVATDNSTYPKAAGFSIRGGPDTYKPFDFFVGQGAIEGFSDAVEGMRVGQSKDVRIAPEKGYGYGDPNLRKVRALVEEIPITAELTRTEFTALYLTEPEPLSGSSVPNPIWGWNVTILVTGALVTVRQAPAPGSIVHPYGRWDARVESVDDAANGGVGIIRVRHLLRPDQVGTIAGSDYGQQFFLRGVDVAAGTWEQDFNREVVGVHLNFQITLMSLKKA